MTSYEIRREMMPMFGSRWVVYEDGKRRSNCSSEKRAQEVIAELKAKRERI